jgi:bifunctional DNA-binding transcriptional regulator/antitoxin component of YhaV-PrlF toxin-antitoxin module
MKLLKVKSRKYKEKQYYKYRINLPEQLIKEAGLKEGDELEAEVKKSTIMIKKK